MGRTRKSADWYKNYICGLGGRASWKWPSIIPGRSVNINTEVTGVNFIV